MTKRARRGSRALSGRTHRNAFLQTIYLLDTHWHLIGGMEPMVQLNRAILNSYMDHVCDDDTTRTGLAYCEGVGDEQVRIHASGEFGAEIDLSQVVAVRRFIESLYFKGVTTNDVIRIRRMFIGRIAAECIPEDPSCA